MLAIEALEQLQPGQLAGVLLLVLETGQDLVLDACQGVLGKVGWPITCSNSFSAWVRLSASDRLRRPATAMSR